MQLDVLATGSTGNCTAVTADGKFLIDCGKSSVWIVNKLNYILPDAILLTHEHGDHSRAVTNFLKRGVDIFATRGTADFFGIARHNLNIICAGNELNICGVNVTVIPASHDAAEPVNFILKDDFDRVLFVTDTGRIPDVDGTFTKIFIEANYSDELLRSANIDTLQRERISQAHLSIEQVELFLQNFPQADVHLLHVSKRHGDLEEFYHRIKL